MASNIQEHQQNDARLSYLEELYDRYKNFVKELYPDLAPDKTYSQFVKWWNGLTPACQQECESDFRKGYEQIVRESTSRRQPRQPRTR